MDLSILLVASFGLALVWFMWRAMKGNTKHLTEDELSDFLSNRMEGRKLKHTREHLLSCDECKTLLDELTEFSHKPKPDRLLKRRF